MGVKVVKKTKKHFETRDKDFHYEMNVTNQRQKLAKQVKSWLC